MGEVVVTPEEKPEEKLEEDPECAPGFHWNGSMCVSDEDVPTETVEDDIPTNVIPPVPPPVIPSVPPPVVPSVPPPVVPPVPPPVKPPIIPSKPTTPQFALPDISAILSMFGAYGATDQQNENPITPQLVTTTDPYDIQGLLNAGYFSKIMQNQKNQKVTQNQDGTVKIATGGQILGLPSLLRKRG